VDKPLGGRSILVVEDDIVLATDLAALLTDAGCKAVLPTTSVASALSTIVHYVIDGAILDVNVQNEWVFPVAHALAAAQVPFLFLTAYAPDSIPAEHRERPFVQKPHVPERLLADLTQMLTPAEAGPKLATVNGEPVPPANDEGEGAQPKSA
jgi:DNA-binding response OmpR family regulator